MNISPLARLFGSQANGAHSFLGNNRKRKSETSRFSECPICGESVYVHFLERHANGHLDVLDRLRRNAPAEPARSTYDAEDDPESLDLSIHDASEDEDLSHLEAECGVASSPRVLEVEVANKRARVGESSTNDEHAPSSDGALRPQSDVHRTAEHCEGQSLHPPASPTDQPTSPSCHLAAHNNASTSQPSSHAHPPTNQEEHSELQAARVHHERENIMLLGEQRGPAEVPDSGNLVAASSEEPIETAIREPDSEIAEEEANEEEQEEEEGHEENDEERGGGGCCVVDPYTGPSQRHPVERLAPHPSPDNERAVPIENEDLPSSSRGPAEAGGGSGGENVNDSDHLAFHLRVMSGEVNECGICKEPWGGAEGRERFLLWPCQHARQCGECALRIWKQPKERRRCPWCKGKIEIRPRTFKPYM
mmetsp:Transcript_37564/g.63228  ORF Transcript_37564/g.63228 Transcript_37564/m.63228 type:complete len:421 (-) Transcript_37564:276-1538(-)